MLKKLFRPIDMTVGFPWKTILLFSLPMLIGNIAQQLYNTADSVVVGNYIGDNALAAVGSASPILNIFLVLVVGISTGVTVMVSQYFGANQKENLSYTIGTSITLTAIASLILIVVLFPLIDPILKLLNTPETIINDCSIYLKVFLITIMGMSYYNILSGILRGLGDSFSPLLYLVIATILNIGLDILFVAKFKMGVMGVSLATGIAQAVSAVLSYLKLRKMTEHFELKRNHYKLNKKYLSKIIKLGLPTGMTQVVFSSAMIIVQSLTNSFGEMLIAANVIIMRIDGFAMMPNFSFGTALTTYAGQNVGAGKYDRVAKGAKEGTLIAVICSVILTSLILIFGKSVMGIFTKTTELVDLSRYLMGILAIGYVAMAVTQSLSGIMRGAGDTVTPMWISVITSVVIRIPIAYGISYLTRTPELPTGRFECIHLSLVSSWVLGALITTIFYKIGKWKKKAIE